MHPLSRILGLVIHLLRLGASTIVKDARGMKVLKVARLNFDGAEALLIGHTSLRKKF